MHTHMRYNQIYKQDQAIPKQGMCSSSHLGHHFTVLLFTLYVSEGSVSGLFFAG